MFAGKVFWESITELCEDLILYIALWFDRNCSESADTIICIIFIRKCYVNSDITNASQTLLGEFLFNRVNSSNKIQLYHSRFQMVY